MSLWAKRCLILGLVAGSFVCGFIFGRVQVRPKWEEIGWQGSKRDRLAIARFISDHNLLIGRTEQEVLQCLGSSGVRRVDGTRIILYSDLGAHAFGSFLVFPSEFFLDVEIQDGKVAKAAVVAEDAFIVSPEKSVGPGE